VGTEQVAAALEQLREEGLVRRQTNADRQVLYASADTPHRADKRT
jgi:Fe2+ or Zn2+ uptake regulation protein